MYRLLYPKKGGYTHFETCGIEYMEHLQNVIKY